MARQNTKAQSKKGASKNPFPHKDLVSVKDLTYDQIKYVFEVADKYWSYNRKKGRKNKDLLKGLLSINLFLEPSTRTRISFEIAAKRMGMEVVNFAPSDSSMTKDETIGSTVDTLYAMNPDLIVLRSSEPALINYAANFLKCPVINAGDGTNEHPTQALLDAYTILSFKLKSGLEKFKDITVTICGDIMHSRVARSNLYLLKTLGANLRVSGPPELMPSYPRELGVAVFEDFEEALSGTDVIMMLRYQKERMKEGFSKSWISRYQLNERRLNFAKKGAIFMHPGPVNWGKELADELAKPEKMVMIPMQVLSGVAMRMALLDILTLPVRKEQKS